MFPDICVTRLFFFLNTRSFKTQTWLIELTSNKAQSERTYLRFLCIDSTSKLQLRTSVARAKSLYGSRFTLSTTLNMCRLAKSGQSQQIQNPVPLHTKIITNKARKFPWNGWLFRTPQCALQWWFTPSFLKYSNILCMTEVTKYCNIVIHKALSIWVQKTPGSVQIWGVFLQLFYL